jgi:hypothetical protein
MDPDDMSWAGELIAHIERAKRQSPILKGHALRFIDLLSIIFLLLVDFGRPACDIYKLYSFVKF